MPKDNLGLVHFYTGDGKGKTTAAVGLATRALGHGFSVYMIQFLKGGAYTGEYLSLNKLFPNSVIQYGKPCVKQVHQKKLESFENVKEDPFKTDGITCNICRECFLDDQEQKDFALDAFSHAKKVIRDHMYDLIILDEISCAVNKGWVDVDELLSVMKERNHAELVFTGRNAHPKLVEAADLVSEVKHVKHYFDKGVPARKGIEY